jgi:demethylmenaquinone methyltransferase/2-methoxy-6-polyprenyl-1,4-benzoquinol methylase
MILEFSKPKSKTFAKLYNWYMHKVTPKIGGAISGNTEAYSYLNKSVQAFPEGKELVAILENCGYKNVLCIPVTFGIASIYLAEKGND